MTRMIEKMYHEQDEHWSNFRGMARSRLEDNIFVGGGQYFDTDKSGTNVCWHKGYIEHYILKHNVMSNKELFDYVIWRWFQNIK